MLCLAVPFLQAPDNTSLRCVPLTGSQMIKETNGTDGKQGTNGTDETGCIKLSSFSALQWKK